MKQLNKKGFTLVELLFVMAIISILAGFAIANLNDSTRVATVTSMKSDVKNAITQIEQEYAATGVYSDHSTTDICVQGTSDTNGMCTFGTKKIPISKGNKMYINYVQFVGQPPGYTVLLRNSTYSDQVRFIKHVDGAIYTF